MKRRRDFRLLPVLMVAVGCLALLKIAGVVLDGGYLLLDELPPQKMSWAQETLNFPVPGGTRADPDLWLGRTVPILVTRAGPNSVAGKLAAPEAAVPVGAVTC